MALGMLLPLRTAQTVFAIVMLGTTGYGTLSSLWLMKMNMADDPCSSTLVHARHDNDHSTTGQLPFFRGRLRNPFLALSRAHTSRFPPGYNTKRPLRLHFPANSTTQHLTHTPTSLWKASTPYSSLAGSSRSRLSSIILNFVVAWSALLPEPILRLLP